MTFDPQLLKDPEIIVRVKRRVGPMNWHIVSLVLNSLQDVLERALPPAPDPMSPEVRAAKRKRKV
jgi:hypothetical protein